MKKVFCFVTLTALFACALTAVAAPKRVVVRTGNEFLDAIGNNRTIVIMGQGFNISDALLERSDLQVDYDDMMLTKKNVFYVYETDGPELHIAGISNLTIEAGDEVVSIVTDPRYANVLSFDKCNNITLKGLTLGHTEEGYCTNGVLAFKVCENINIERCDLYGCGTEGLNVDHCKNAKVYASKIRDCSYYIMHLHKSANISFDSCQFFRNREFEQISVSTCENVVFFNCMIANNTGSLFSLNCPITLRDCVILHSTESLGTTDGITSINNIVESYFHEEQLK